MAVYFIKCNEYVKIGVAMDVEQRLYELQTGNPYNLVLIGKIPGGYRTEGILHKRFREMHIVREWFILTQEMVDIAEGRIEVQIPKDTMSKSQFNLDNLSEADRVRLVANTALIAQVSGGVTVFNGRYKSAPGVMIWIPGYNIDNGEMNKLPVVANEE